MKKNGEWITYEPQSRQDCKELFKALGKIDTWPADSLEVEDITPKVDWFMRWCWLGVIVAVLLTWILVSP